MSNDKPEEQKQTPEIDNKESETAEILALGQVRLPEFWPQIPDTWFKSVEAQFALKNVSTDNRRYQILLTSLPGSIIQTVTDIVNDPPAANKYDTLKNAVIERNSLSEERRLDQLLSGHSADMGDRRPSEFFRYLETLAGSTVTG